MIIVIVFIALLSIVVVNYYFYPSSSVSKIYPIATYSSNEQYSSWQLVQYSDDKFQVEFPGIPTIEKKYQDSTNINHYFIVDSNNRFYNIVVSHYENGLDDNAINNISQTLLGSYPESKIIESNLVSVGGYQGIEYLMQHSENLFQKGISVIVNNNVLYRVTYNYENDSYSQDDYIHFINSFTIYK